MGPWWQGLLLSIYWNFPSFAAINYGDYRLPLGIADEAASSQYLWVVEESIRSCSLVAGGTQRMLRLYEVRSCLWVVRRVAMGRTVEFSLLAR